MDYLKSIGAIGAILYVAYIFLQRVRKDEVIASLKHKDRTEENEAIKKAQKELEDAEIRYRKSRGEYDAISGLSPDAEDLDE